MKKPKLIQEEQMKAPEVSRSDVGHALDEEGEEKEEVDA